MKEQALFWLTLTSMTLVIFHRSMRRPMKTLTCTTKLVSLSSMYSSTTRDWNTPNMMERTDRPSRDCLLFQNWISEGEMMVRWSWGVDRHKLFFKKKKSSGRVMWPYHSWRQETRRCCARWRQQWWVPAGTGWFPKGPPTQREWFFMSNSGHTARKLPTQ